MTKPPWVLPETCAYSHTVAHTLPLQFWGKFWGQILFIWCHSRYSTGNDILLFFFPFSCFVLVFIFNNSCALKELLFVSLTMARIWEVWKMLLRTTDQRFFSLRTGSLPSCTLIKFSPFTQVPEVFSFPPSSFSSGSTLGELMKWLCCEGDSEGLSSQRPQVPSPVRPVH